MSTSLVPQKHGGSIYSRGRPPGFKNPNAGRPTDLTPQIMEALCKDLELGLKPAQVCALHRVSQQNFYNWLERGQQNNGNAIYHEFFERITESRVIPEKRALEIIWFAAVGRGDEKSAQWLNERLYPERYAKRQVIAVGTSPEIGTDW